MDKNTVTSKEIEFDSLPIDTTVFDDQDSSAICFMYEKEGRAHALCYAHGKQTPDADVNFAHSTERDDFVNRYVEKIRNTEH